MKKGLLVIGCLLLVASLIGCGQTTPQIKTEVTTTPQPQGLTIRGAVYGNTIDGNCGNPLSEVVVILNGSGPTAAGVKAALAVYTNVTTTDAKGQFVFTDLPEGSYSWSDGFTIVATKEGYQRFIQSGIGMSGLDPLPDNSEINVDIAMDGDPVVLSISPVPGTTIEAAVQTIAVAFNEAMDPSTVRPALTSQGMRTFAIADTQPLTTTWSADGKILYITTGALLANKRYQLEVDPSGIAKDASGYALEASAPTNSGGLDNTIYNQTSADYYYRTASGGAPGAPTGVLLTVNNQTAIDYSDADSSHYVDLSWLAPASGVISGYKIYVSNSSSGPWALLDDDIVRNTDSITNTKVNQVLYGAFYNADSIRQMAFVTDTVYFRIAAINAEGETTSETVAMRDSVKPTITTHTGAVDRNPNVVGIGSVYMALTNFALTGATLNKGCYIAFSEPMNPASLTNPTKYTLSTGTVTSATVVFNDNGVTVVQLVFSGAINPGVDTVTVSTSGPVDLSGNVMSGTGNSRAIN